MAITYVPWNPVYNYGCGWRECPECGPMIELEIERKHLKRVAGSNPQIDTMSEWLGEAYGTGPERVAATRPPPANDVLPIGRKKAAKKAQKVAKGRIRVKRSLSEAKLNEAQTALDALVALKKKTVARYGEWELRNETWCELLNPSKQAATPERYAAMEVKVSKAFDRARYTLDKLARASTRDAATGSTYAEAA